MQRLWKVVLGSRRASNKQLAAMRVWKRNRRKSLNWISQRLAEQGVTNGGGAPYHRHHLKELIEDGLTAAFCGVCEKPESVVRPAVRQLMRGKRRYSRRTKKDPYLAGRLSWWRKKLRKVGKKPSSSWYEKDRGNR